MASTSYQSSFNYFEDLFKHAKENSILIMDEKGIVIEISKSFSDCFGYTEKDIIGKDFKILFTKEDNAKGMPQTELASVLKKGQANDNNYLVHQNQTITWVLGESVLVTNKDGDKLILKVVQNIHKVKESEIALRNLNEFNENILSSIEDVVIILNQDLEVIKANNAFFELFKNDVRGVPADFKKIIQRYDEEGILLSHVQQSFTSKNNFSRHEIKFKTDAGDKRFFEVSGIQMGNKDENVLLVAQDVTARKRLEKEREDVINLVAHELRNPLTNLLLSHELMCKSIDNNNLDQQKEFLKRSMSNVRRLQKIVSELYLFSKSESGTIQLELSRFDFNDMVQDAIDTVKSLAPDYNIVFKHDGNITATGDRYRLIQVITNYLGNSIKYSNGNTDIILAIRPGKNMVTVSVKDEGMGISKSQLPFVFDRMFRADHTDKIDGLGLGLYICRRIITAHHGNVWVESEQGKGSTFYFSIPMEIQ